MHSQRPLRPTPRRSGALSTLRAIVHALAWATVLAGTAATARADDAPITLPPTLPEVDAPRVVSLADVVNLALERNPTARVAYDEIRRAEAIVEETRASSLPTLTGNGSYTRLDAPRVSNGVVLDAENELNLNAALAVPLIVPKSWAKWSQSGDQVDVAKLSAADVRRTLAVAVARAYLAVVVQKRVIEAVTRARDADDAHAKFAQQRLAGGVGNRLDQVRASQQVQSDVATVEQQRTSLAKDREALGVIVGVGGPLDAAEPNLQTPVDMQQAMRDAEHRTDVVTAESKSHASEHAVRDDWTEYSPYLTGAAQAFYNDPASVTQPTTGWQAMLILTVPFYDGGLRYGLEKERAALRDEATANLEATLRQARSDVRAAFEEMRHADAALDASRRAADLARSGLELTELAYRGGATTNIEVIDAERTARDAETAVAVAEDGARQARLDMLSATGRFP